MLQVNQTSLGLLANDLINKEETCHSQVSRFKSTKDLNNEKMGIMIKTIFL